MLGIQNTKEVAAYLRKLCAAELQSNGRKVPFPKWPVDLLEECEYAAKVIVQAIKNPSKSLPLIITPWLTSQSVRTEWSVVDYVEALRNVGPRCTGQQDKVENKLMESFPPCESTLLSAPTVICDRDGLVMAWYLPGILSPQRQVSGTFRDIY
jgi:hypothetical protein